MPALTAHLQHRDVACSCGIPHNHANMQFNGLYEAAIDGAERAALPAKRIAAIIDHMTFEIYKYIQRGLFERHKLIFAWMLTASILVSAGKARPRRIRICTCCQQLHVLASHCSPLPWPSPACMRISAKHSKSPVGDHTCACRSRRTTSISSCAAAGLSTLTASARSPRCVTVMSVLQNHHEIIASAELFAGHARQTLDPQLTLSHMRQAAERLLQEWVPDSVWLNVVALGGMDAFRDLADAVVRGDAAWRAWYDAEAPERAPVPGYEERLSKFERTCIVKARRSRSTVTGTWHAHMCAHDGALISQRTWGQPGLKCLP